MCSPPTPPPSQPFDPFWRTHLVILLLVVCSPISLCPILPPDPSSLRLVFGRLYTPPAKVYSVFFLLCTFPSDNKLLGVTQTTTVLWSSGYRNLTIRLSLKGYFFSMNLANPNAFPKGLLNPQSPPPSGNPIHAHPL